MSKYLTNQWKERIKELEKKHFLDAKQGVTMLQMLTSKDDENFTILEILVKNIIKDKLAEPLNEGQKKAYYDIIEFLDDPQNNQAVVLKGYAGTGKTFLVKQLIEYIGQTEPESKIAITAPTNKAVKVLYKSSVGNVHTQSSQVFEDIFDLQSRLTYSTIHKLLGLTEKISADGKQTFDSGFSDTSKLNKYQYLIVDEVSMLNNKLCTNLLEYSENIRIIFMGDAAQIPPINSTDSLPFLPDGEYKFKRAALTEIMRQKGDNAIIATSFTLRENLHVMQPLKSVSTQLNNKDQGIVYFNSETEKDKIRPLLAQYFKCPEFEADSNYMKVIAWRNKTIDYVNNIIRELIFGPNPKRFEIGEKLIVQKPIFKMVKHKKYGLYWKCFLNTSDEVTITDINENTYTKSIGKDVFHYKTIALTVDYEDLEGDIVSGVIDIIKDEYLEPYNQFREKLRDKAKNAVGSTLKLRKELWKDYYDTKKWTANVIYNYGISAHKS